MENLMRTVAFAKRITHPVSAGRQLLDRTYSHFGHNADRRHEASAIVRHTEEIPEIRLSELVRDDTFIQMREPVTVYGSLTAPELTIINKMIRQSKPMNIFEIGTFQGKTTLNMAANSPLHAKVFTLDLPPGLQQFPTEIDNGSDAVLGSNYRGTDCEAKIVQLYGDSLTFDFSPFFNTIDFMLIDGAHTYENTMSDSKIALRLMRDGRGTILWHNYDDHFEGAVRALNECYSKGNGFSALRRIEGTSIVCMVLRRQ